MGYIMSGKSPAAYKKGMAVKVGQTVKFKNGALATKQANGQFKIKQGASKAAAMAFHKFYSRRSAYKSPKSMRAAITRDLCHKKSAKNTRDNTAYLRARGGPMRFDYPGFDDGTMCPKGRKKYVYKKRSMPAKAVAALKKFRASGKKRVYRKLPKTRSK